MAAISRSHLTASYCRDFIAGLRPRPPPNVLREKDEDVDLNRPVSPTAAASL